MSKLTGSVFWWNSAAKLYLIAWLPLLSSTKLLATARTGRSESPQMSIFFLEVALPRAVLSAYTRQTLRPGKHMYTNPWQANSI